MRAASDLVIENWTAHSARSVSTECQDPSPNPSPDRPPLSSLHDVSRHSIPNACPGLETPARAARHEGIRIQRRQTGDRVRECGNRASVSAGIEENADMVESIRWKQRCCCCVSIARPRIVRSWLRDGTVLRNTRSRYTDPYSGKLLSM